MKRYFCNGKKGYCDRGNDNKIDCSACEFADGTGGKIVDCPYTNYERIKAMSIDEMALLFHTIIKATEQKLIDKLIEAEIPFDKIDLANEIQIEIHKQFLESEVEEE